MKYPLSSLLAACVLLCVSSPSLAVAVGDTQTGIASYYHDALHGRPTASGKRYNKNALSGAHRKWPLGTQVRVTNLKNGRSVELKINDRGPYRKGRIIDLSGRAAKQLQCIKEGTVKVRLEVIATP